MSQNPAEALPPSMQLIQMAMGHWVSHIIHLAAELELADHLAKGPKTAEELAGATKTHAPSLYRFLRTLSSLGVFAEDGSRRFGLTPMGEALRTGAPGAARPTILTFASEYFFKGYREFRYSLETGKPAFEKALGMPIFDWLGQHPKEASMFSETMVGFHGMEPPAVAAACDFSGMKTIVDVGGATGNLLTAVLGKASGAKGVLFDMPHVVKDAPGLLQSKGMTDRVKIESGSFFDRVPSGGDAYLLSHIIHDWSEAQCLTILGNVRKAMNPGGRILIVEMVLPTGNTPHPGKMLDLMMLIGPGGQERTEEEYAALLQKAKLKLTRVIPTQSPVSVVEAVQA